MKYYNIDYKEILKQLNSCEDGLTDKQVQKNVKENGKNILKESKKDSNLKKFLNQFKDMMIIILCIASIISFVISYVNQESYIDSIAIIAIVIINAILGFFQEMKADKALEALKKMQTTNTKVKRDGKVKIIDSKDIVVGDIIVLEAGDTIPADARIIYAASLKCDEAALTGESIPLDKSIDVVDENTPLSMRNNMIYSGTSVVYGKGIAVVTATGMNTEFGKIAESLNKHEKEITPLEQKINGISKVLSIIISIIIVIMFIVGLLKGMKLTEVIMLSISLAVAAIPEGLPAVITITLSLGVSSMAKKRAIIRKMSSVETLGCTEIICSDKTGTITQNKMTVRKVFFDNKIINADEKIDKTFLEIMALNNDVEKDNKNYIGDPTEIALYNICEHQSIDINSLRNKYKRIDELPFDSDRKMMSTINKYDSNIKLLTKGSFDSIINCCSYILEDGKVQKLDDLKKQELKDIEIKLSNEAYRILAFAYKDLTDKYDLNNNLENNLIFVGMTCMIDPPRIDVKEAIASCKTANIKPIMITGDSLDTAIAISREIGILENKEQAITGTDLDKYSFEELKEKVKDYSVYARVSPTNKLNIVNAWKANNKIVAMTGDGVNDAPALKTANIGIGMGITGTEVSKGVSDVILSDDSFSTIVTAVKEGRRIYDNIRNVLVYLLTSNITEILVVFIGMIFGLEIFLPIQLLYINLITDSIPAIALSFEEAAADVMNRKTRKKDESFFTPFLIAKMISTSSLKTIAILLAYFVGLNFYGTNVASTMAFLCLILLEMLFSYSCRNLKNNILEIGVFKNKYLNRSIFILIAIQLIVFLTPLKTIFNLTDLTQVQVIYCFITVLPVVLIDELLKNKINKKFKD